MPPREHIVRVVKDARKIEAPGALTAEFGWITGNGLSCEGQSWVGKQDDETGRRNANLTLPRSRASNPSANPTKFRGHRSCPLEVGSNFFVPVHDPVGFFQYGQFRVIKSGRRVVVADDVFHNLDFFGWKANRLQQVLRNGWAIFLLRLAVVIPVLLLRHLDAHVMQKSGSDDDVRIAPGMVGGNAIGMMQNAEGVFDTPVIGAEVLRQYPHQSCS